MTIETRKAALVGGASTHTLVVGMLALEQVEPRNPETQRALTWLYAEVEKRYPAAVAEMEETFLTEEAVASGAGEHLTYGQMLVAVLPSSAMTA